jgi:hypothetical protein
MSIMKELKGESICFSLQDVDRAYAYVLVLNALGIELGYQMEIDAPVIREYEDETGYYLIAEFDDNVAALNYMDLFLDALSEPELEGDLDLGHLQAFTYNPFIQQRYANNKHQMLCNFAYNMFNDMNEDGNLPSRLLALEQVVEYNAVPKLRTILNIMSHAMENNGIEVAQKINEASVPTIH